MTIFRWPQYMLLAAMLACLCLAMTPAHAGTNPVTNIQGLTIVPVVSTNASGQSITTFTVSLASGGGSFVQNGKTVTLDAFNFFGLTDASAPNLQGSGSSVDGSNWTFSKTVDRSGIGYSAPGSGAGFPSSKNFVEAAGLKNSGLSGSHADTGTFSFLTSSLPTKTNGQYNFELDIYSANLGCGKTERIDFGYTVVPELSEMAVMSLGVFSVLGLALQSRRRLWAG